MHEVGRIAMVGAVVELDSFAGILNGPQQIEPLRRGRVAGALNPLNGGEAVDRQDRRQMARGVRAVQVTTRFHLTHGAPVHMGRPEKIGIADLSAPDFGDAVTIRPGEIPVFWACGVTSQLAATSAALPLIITHSPGHMFVSDLKDEDLTVL